MPLTVDYKPVTIDYNSETGLMAGFVFYRLSLLFA